MILITVSFFKLKVLKGGKNNVFQIYERNERSFLSHEKAVLEHIHAALMLKILSNPECDVLHTFPDDVKKRLKDIMVEGIMATDMTRHFAIIEEFKNKSKFDPEKLEDKRVKRIIIN